MSETSTCRASLSKWCGPLTLDIGFGGDPIVPWAICIDRDENDGSRAHVGLHPTHIKADAFGPLPFKSSVVDTAYSSHCLEDAPETAAVLEEWCRVLKVGGYLVLFLPDQPTYEAHCAANGTLPNQAHVHKDFSLKFVTDRLPDNMDIVHSAFPLEYNAYSFELVCQKRAVSKTLEENYRDKMYEG